MWDERCYDFFNRSNTLLDSGAYTAFKSKKEINLEDYCSFVKNPPFKLWRYFALDKIGDSKATDRNLQIMLDKGLKPIPVFQRGQPLDKLYELLGKFDLVGIGGVAGTNDRNSYLKWILQRPDIDKQRLHLLGVLNIDIIKQYRPYSCDSSFLVFAPKFATITYYDPISNSLKRIGREIISNKKLMGALPTKIQEGLMTADGWIHSTKLIANNAHLKASLFFAIKLAQYLENVNCKLFLIFPNTVPQVIFYQLQGEEWFV